MLCLMNDPKGYELMKVRWWDENNKNVKFKAIIRRETSY